MHAEERRKQITKLLEQASGPLSASYIAAQFAVSRQIIVGDVALLRAGGLNVLATPRGYVLEPASELAEGVVYTLACRHGLERQKEELYTIIDNGGAVLDVTVEHSVYGQICAPLHLFSRYDVDEFQDKLARSGARPLSALTDGTHLHRIHCPSQAVFERVRAALQEKGLLYDKGGLSTPCAEEDGRDG